MKAALYLRVSTGSQTVENQRIELERIAAARGWEIVATYSDEGISGAKGRDKRPGFDALCKAAARREFDLIAAWSIDRVGRSLANLVGFMVEMQSLGVGLYFHQQSVDSTTPGGRALLGMASVFAEFERSLLIERINAGVARARQEGTRSGKAIGRPRVPPAKLDALRGFLADGMSLRRAADMAGVGEGTAARLRATM
jgi:DNA invertase Pin-like site-specific DNA recombinase